MFLNVWRKFDDIDKFSKKVENMFEDILSSSFLGLRREGKFIPSTDVIETKDKYTLKFDLPGFDKDDIKIEFQNNIFSIKGEKKQEKEIKEENYWRKERTYGKFCRSVALPSTNVASDKIKAKLTNGILEISIPKAEKTKEKTINIE